MRYYITKTEKRIIIFALIFYTLLSLVLCFKGMKIVTEYNQLEKEKQELEELVEAYKEQLEGI